MARATSQLSRYRVAGTARRVRSEQRRQTQLDMTGNSVSRMLGSADGEAAPIMEGGAAGELAIRLMNLDLANAPARLIGGDRRTPIDCMVSKLNAVDGAFRIQAIVLNTPRVNVHGSGDVRIDTEALNVTLAACHWA